MKNKIPSIGDGFKQGGCRWRVVDTTADVITLQNGKGEQKTIYPSQLVEFQPLKVG